MTFKKISLIIFLAFYLLPIQNIFAQMPNTGFIPANIWYSEDPFEEGDKIKIYTLIYNPDNRELSGTIVFFDNTVFLGKKDFKTPAKSVKDIYIDWTATSGSHTIFAKIENAKFLISTGKYEEVYLAENKTEESKKNISKKIISSLPQNITSSITDNASVSNVQKIIKENTPTFVTNSIDYTVNSLEKIKNDSSTYLENKKIEVAKEIEIINKTKINTEKDISLDGVKDKKFNEKLQSSENKNLVLKPFKIAELFILKIISYIFKYTIIFYGLILLIVFVILRYLWRLVF